MSEKFEGYTPPQESPKKFEEGTGKEVITEPPYDGFKWKEGYVLVRTEDNKGGPHGSAIIGGDAFHWMPEGEVQIESEK